MVAKITIPKSIAATLNYNEKKVQKGQASCICATNYLKEPKDMNFYQKLAGFERLNSLNDRAATKTLHVSLNFDPSEKHSNDILTRIANQYMEKIGFGQQPFLVYRHEDAGHPHIHIVSTTIKSDGSRINTHNIGRNQSEKARKEIEQQYGLVKAERQQHLIKPGIKQLDIDKVIYGKSETKRGISNIVGAVFGQYKYTSLPEFNAALKQFNVVADRGKEDGRIYRHCGLVYRILDANGSKMGVPIKASAICCKPTLANLEKKFTINETLKESLKAFVRAKLDECLSKQPGSMKDMMQQLQQNNIYTALRQNADGRLYGITFVDNQNRVVFNGSDLGKGYSAAAMQGRLGKTAEPLLYHNQPSTGNSLRPLEKKTVLEKNEEKSVAVSQNTETLLNVLLSAKDQYDGMTNRLLKKKRKKKKKKPDL